MSRNEIILLFFLLSLIIALFPITDMDLDGVMDSFITEGFLMAPASRLISAMSPILMRLPGVSPCNPITFSTLLVLPPIFSF